MSTNNFINKHFDSAMSIHNRCEELGLSRDYARVLTYVHVKTNEPGNEDYFDKDNLEVVEILDFMLNKKRVAFDVRIKPESQKKIRLIPKKLHSLDAHLRENYGMEIRISSELKNRRRMHSDKEYREKILAIYKKKILPFIGIKKSAA